MTADQQTVTPDQLARLYRARNEASNFNRAYNAAMRQYKRQQKAAARAQWRTTMIRFYMDYKEKSSAV